MSTPCVLITGAAGFLGRNVARRFADARWQVVGLGHGTWTVDEARSCGFTEWHAADVTFDALSNTGSDPAVIVHCAGSGSVGYSLAHPFQDFHRSCASLAATLEYVRLRANSTRVVYLSSAAVYGQRDAAAIREDSRLDPISPYGSHKAMGESLCAMYGAHYGVATTVVRLFSVYGCGLRKQLLWEACSRAAHAHAEFGGTGAETRDWIEVSDAAELIFCCADRAAPTRFVVNGGTGDAPTVRAVVSELLSRLGVNGQLRFSGVARPGDPQHYRADISAARSLGWQPKVRWQDGVRAYADWFRSECT